MVTVVDAGAFLEAYTTADRMMQRPDLGVLGGWGAPGRNRVRGREGVRARRKVFVLEDAARAEWLLFRRSGLLRGRVFRKAWCTQPSWFRARYPSLREGGGHESAAAESSRGNAR